METIPDRSDQAEIKVGVGISCARGTGAAQMRGHHPRICLACGDKAVHDHQVVSAASVVLVHP